MEKIKFVEVENETPLKDTGFYVQFNPETMTISEPCVASKSKTFRESTDDKPNAKPPNANIPVENEKKGVVITLKLLFNTLTSFEEKEYQDVRQAISQFYPFLNTVDKEVKGIGVIYGSMSIVGFVTSFSTTYTSFDAHGKALRADVDISIEGKHYGIIEKNTYKDHRVAHIMKGSFAESLKASKDVRQWKQEAKAMRVEDPFLK